MEHHAYGFLHGGVDDPDDSGGELFRRELRSVVLQPLGDQAAGAFEIQHEIATQKSLRAQPAEKKIRVGHGGLGTAAIADRTRIGSGGFGPDAQCSAGVEAGNGTTARAYGVYIEHGHTNRKTGDFGVAAGAQFAVYQRDIGGSPAHVESDDSFKTAASGHGDGSYDSSGRPGEDGAYRFAGCGSERCNSSTGLHDKDAGRGRGDRYFGERILQIALHHRLQVSVHNDCTGAFVFAELGKNPVRDRERYPEFLQDAGDVSSVFGLANENSSETAMASGSFF